MTIIPTTDSGSEWKKWDLHLHSFYTSLNNNFSGSTEDDYIEKIKYENIQVVGLTNYFNFTENDLELKEKLENSGIFVFLNLELRLTYVNKEDDCCDIHLIFSNELEIDDINTFLTKLNCTISGSGDKKPLSAIKTKREKEVAVVEFNDLVNALNDPAVSNLKGKVLIGILSRGKGNSRSSSMYASLAKNSDFVIHSSTKVKNVEDDIKFWSGKESKKPLECKALFQSSDAHDINTIGERFSWVKGNLSFETLRQAVVDYESRIAIQERNPSENKSSSPELLIKRIEYKQNSKSQKVYFNQDMNSVIGKRGGGKSVLLKHIAYAVLGVQKNPTLMKISKLEDFKLYWSDEKDEDKFVEYIPQNYLSAITYEDGDDYDKRDEMLKERLFNNELFKNANINKQEVVDSIELKINENIKDLLNLHKRVFDTKNQLKPLGKVADKNNSIEAKRGEIKKLGVIDIKDEEVKTQTEYSLQIKVLHSQIELLKQDIEIINSIGNDVNFLRVDDDVFLGLSQTTLTLIKKHIQKLSTTEIKDYLGDLRENLNKEISKKEKEVEAKEEVLEPLNKKLQQNKVIEDILKEINKLDVEKKEIEDLNKFINESSNKIAELINEIADSYLSLEGKIEGIVQTLRDEFSDFTFITFDFTVGYSIEQYKSKFFDPFVDGRSGERYKKLIDEERDFNKDELVALINDIVNDIETAKLKVTTGDKESALVALLSCRYDIDFTKSVKYKNGAELIDFENMTGGQKAMALLDLIFNMSKSGYPIIIDQPENDIDVSGISNELSKLLIDQKRKRQVIVATHSPNLLLLTDSENVIVAENEGNMIKYHNGGIENQQIQVDIMSILEGGEHALQKRMAKLNK